MTTVLAVSGIQQLPYDAGFYEQQQSSGCGRHALNNLFHAQYFVKRNGAKPIDDATVLTIEPPDIPLQDLCDYLNGKYDFLGGCPDNENYDINILTAALDIIGHPYSTAVWSIQSDGTMLLTPVIAPNQLLGYVLNYGGGHWTTLRKVPNPVNEYQAFEYVNSIRNDDGTPDRAFFPSVDECLHYLQREEGRYISNIIEVGVFERRLNPNDRLSKVDEGVEKAAREAREFADAKADLQNAFTAKFKGAIGETETIGEEVTVDRMVFQPNTPLFRFIAERFLAHPQDSTHVLQFQTLFEAADPAVFANYVKGHKGSLLHIKNAVDFLVVLQSIPTSSGGPTDAVKAIAAKIIAAAAKEKTTAGKTTATGKTGGKTTATTAVPVPLSKVVLVRLSGNTFLLDIGSNADKRRKEYSESKGSAALEAEELRLLKFLGADPTVPAIRPLLHSFFQTVVKCNSDAKAAINNGCDMPIHFLWMIRQFRRDSAAKTTQTKLIGGFQLAALRAMVKEAPRMIAFMRASKLLECARTNDTSQGQGQGQGQSKGKGKGTKKGQGTRQGTRGTASVADPHLAALFTV